ncbi:MAG: hypothetical protein DSZ31_01060 [Gammaproteobacteria bacterium]|nr:MAG: hypothetical protein DSZ31_01060 [Gammaproteobacteria bacterium]
MEKVKATFLLHALGDGLGEYPHLREDKKPIPPTDDTVMTLALLEVLVEERKHNPQRVAQKYLSYLREGILKKVGYTTLEALKKFEKTQNWFYSGIACKRCAGNGVAMRISPLGVWAYLRNLPLEEFFETVRAEGYITHRNELAISGAFAVAYAVYLNLKENLPKEETVKRVLLTMEHLGMENPVKEAVENALNLKGLDGKDALRRLGSGGYIVETIGAVFYLFLSQEDFLEGLDLLLEVGGDTDTVGAIFGSLYGSLHGLKNIPENLISRLEVKEKIEQLTEKLFSHFHP